MVLKTLLTIISIVLLIEADTIITFKPNTTAKASEINANFNLLMEKIDSIKSLTALLHEAQNKVTTLEKRLDTMILKVSTAGEFNNKCDSMEKKIVLINSTISANSNSLSSIYDSLNECRNRIKFANDSILAGDARNYMPIGTIIASMFAPDNNGFLKRADGSVDNNWEIAAGQRNGIPDLRGVFLRGIDFIAAGKALTGRDVARSSGSYQEDAFPSHNHGVTGDPGQLGIGHTSRIGEKTTTDENDTGGSGTEPDIQNKPEALPMSGNGNETRPKNVAVYYYVKVK